MCCSCYNLPDVWGFISCKFVQATHLDFVGSGESWIRGFPGPRWDICVQEPRAGCRQGLHGIRLLQDVHSESQRRTAQLFCHHCRNPTKRQLPKEAFQQEPWGLKLGMYKSGAAAGQLQLGLTSRKVEIYGILWNSISCLMYIIETLSRFMTRLTENHI